MNHGDAETRRKRQIREYIGAGSEHRVRTTQTSSFLSQFRYSPITVVEPKEGPSSMIKQIGMKQFKSWQSIEAMPIAPITGLFGTNSSGKSSIIQLLLMMKQTVESSDRAQVLEFGDENSLANLGSFKEVIYQHDTTRQLQMDVRWSLPRTLSIQDPSGTRKQVVLATQDLEFACKVMYSDSERLTVEELRYAANAEEFTLRRKGDRGSKYELSSRETGYRFTRTLGRAWDLPAPVKFYGFPDQVYAYYQNAGFLADLQLEFEGLFKRIYYLGPLREFPQRLYTWKGSEPADMGRRGERVVDAILAARDRGRAISPGYKRKRVTLEERVATWLKELGLIHSFEVDSVAKESGIYRVLVKKSPGSAKVLITDVGFGVSQILPVLVLCYYVPEGSTVLLEQPEIHLHPSVQSGLADVFLDVAKNRNVQVIVESHSEHLLRRLQLRVAEGTEQPEGIALYFCEPGDSGSTLTPLDVDLYGNITNWPKDFFGDEFGEIAAMHKAALERKKGRQA